MTHDTTSQPELDSPVSVRLQESGLAALDYPGSSCTGRGGQSTLSGTARSAMKRNANVIAIGSVIKVLVWFHPHLLYISYLSGTSNVQNAVARLETAHSIHMRKHLLAGGIGKIQKIHYLQTKLSNRQLCNQTNSEASRNSSARNPQALTTLLVHGSLCKLIMVKDCFVKHARRVFGLS